MTLALQLLVNGVVVGALLALVALGLAVIFGVMRVINFAHGEFITLGAYLTWLLAGRLGLTLHRRPALLDRGRGARLVGSGADRPTRRDAPALDMLMATYALSALALGLFSIVFGGDFRSYSAGPSGDLEVWGVSIGFRSLTVLVGLRAADGGGPRAAALRPARVGSARGRREPRRGGEFWNRRQSNREHRLQPRGRPRRGRRFARQPDRRHDPGGRSRLGARRLRRSRCRRLGSVTAAIVAAIGIGLLQSFSGFALDDGLGADHHLCPALRGPPASPAGTVRAAGGGLRRRVERRFPLAIVLPRSSRQRSRWRCRPSARPPMRASSSITSPIISCSGRPGT